MRLVISNSTHPQIQQQTINVLGIAPEVEVQIALGKCAWCGDEFAATVAEKLYCCGNCRKTAHRKNSNRKECVAGNVG